MPNFEQDNERILQALPADFKAGDTLPAAVNVDPAKLTKDQQAQIKALRGANPAYFIKIILLNWAIILGIITSAVFLNNIFFTLFTMFIVASRQNVFGLLVHEQAHCLGFSGKYGDGITNLLAAWPLLVFSVEAYAKIHIAHHGFFFTEKDPDFVRKKGKEWTFPHTKLKFMKIWLMDFLGLNIVKAVKAKNANIKTVQRKQSLPSWVRPVYYLFFAAVFTYFQLWTIFLIYWVIPIVTFLQLIIRLASLCEHKYDILNRNAEHSTPLIILSFWEKIFFTNLNFTYHIYHHIYPGISCVNLPKVHEIYKKAGLVNEDHIFYGYWQFIRYLQTHK